MQVELDIFSGRLNPKWTLTTAEEANFQQVLSNCPAISSLKSEPLDDGLGYRGFRIVSSESNFELIVKGVYIQLRKNDIHEIRLDANRDLEKMLVYTARTRLDENLNRRLIEMTEAL